MFAPAVLPLVITVKFNGKIISEKRSMQVPPTATWEEAGRMFLGEQASTYASLPLQVDLFPNGLQVGCAQATAAEEVT